MFPSFFSHFFEEMDLLDQQHPSYHPLGENGGFS